jgi:hypothetical protein
MRSKGFSYLLALLILPLITGLACMSPTPTAAPAPSSQESQPTAESASSSSGVATFTDQNKYFAIDVPADWKHTSGTDTNLYWDRFSSPDEHGFIESIAYDDGTVWTGSQNGRGALYLLNHYYSSTQQEGDIRVSDDSMQKDGSERLTWTSKGGKYSGVSFFEIRHKTTFLMFTTWWGNDYQDKYKPVLDNVVASYRLP